ncbi:MAG: hypothetical protein ABJH20_02605 [Rhizobiaceae bacterium]|uniref:hypothetical protein n=1 Tax=Shimia sp. TaxID=1954381 RepID=UPI00329953E7
MAAIPMAAIRITNRSLRMSWMFQLRDFADLHSDQPNWCFRPKCMYRLLFANDFLHVLGSRSHVSGLLIDTRVVALLGLRTRRDLISGQVDYDLLGRLTLGA